MDAVPDPDGAAALLDGRYDVGPLVGLGGTAQVYRAWDHEDGCAVAVKVFRPGSAPAPGYGGARELEVLTGVRHAGLVGVRGAGVDPQGCPFVVMDLVDGESLSARLHDGPLTAAAVARLGAVLADALAIVHARGVVHRDVKPANVLLDADDHPWLTDFGIARIVDATRVTATGIVVGTAAYMAPEQVRGEAVGPPADVYALGLVLLEAATGHREYDGGALESALARLHRAPVVPTTLPDPLGATLRRMTAPDPDDRPPASEVAAALRGRVPVAPVGPGPVAVGPGPGNLRSGAPVGPVGPRPGVPGPDDRPRRVRAAVGLAARRAVPVAALACLVAGALTGALSLTAGERPAEEQRGVVAPAAVPPVPLAVAPVPDVAAAVLAPAPAPVALASPERAAPQAGVRVPRAVAAVERSGDDDSDGHARNDTRGNAHRDDTNDTSAAAAKNDRDEQADGEKDDRDEKADSDKDSEKNGSGEKADEDHGGSNGKSGSGKGQGGGGHGGKGDRSKSGSDDDR